MRAAPEAAPERVLVFTTLAAPERRRLRGKRATSVHEAEPEPVPTSRVTVIDPEPLADPRQALAWLAGLQAGDGGSGAVDAAVAVVNRALHAYRTARADPGVRDVTSAQALVLRVGYGSGDAVADGRYEEALELPRSPRRAVRRTMEAPEERFAALLGGREDALACEELLLRARSDLDAGRTREAALQARVALESLLTELAGDLEQGRRSALDADRGAVGEAANQALAGPLPSGLEEAVRSAVGRMEAALRAHRLGRGR